MQVNLRALSITLVLAGIISAPANGATDQDSQILLTGAKKWVEKDRSDLAKGLLNKLLLIHPGSPEALLLLGEIALKNNKPDEALRYLQRLEQNAPESPQTRKLGDALRLAARAESKDALANTPIQAAKPSNITKKNVRDTTTRLSNVKENTHPTQVQAKTAAANQAPARPTVADSPESSQENAGTALANSPDILARTDALDAIADGNLKVAEPVLQDLLKRRPQDPEVLGGLGLIQHQQEKFAEAQLWFEQAIQAAQATKTDITRWEDILVMAKFGQNMVTAKDLLKKNHLTAAENAVQQGLFLRPGDPGALAILGDIKAADHDITEAERLYREALAKEGYNVVANRGLATLLANTGRTKEALELIEHTLQTNSTEWSKNPNGYANILRTEANLHMGEHRTAPAIQALEQALTVDPTNPWVRLSLARLYISLDLVQLGLRVIQEGINLTPKDAQMNFVRALFLIGLDDIEGGLDSLAQIPDAEMDQEMLDLKKRAMIKYHFQQAEERLAKGDRKEAIRIMSVAEILARGNYSATEQAAENLFQMGLQEQALSAMRQLPQPVPLQTQIKYASLLNRAKQDQELTSFLPLIRIPDSQAETSLKDREAIREVEFSMAGRQFEMLKKAGREEQAQQFADAIFNANKLSSRDYFKFHRTYFNSSELPDSAIRDLINEKQQHPDDLGIRWDLANAYAQEHQKNSAKNELQGLLAITKSDDIDMRLRIARLLQEIGDASGSRQTLDELINRFPKNANVLFQAGNIARSDGQYNRAVRYYKKTKELELQPATSEDKAGTLTVKNTEPDITLNLLPKKSLPDDTTITKGRVAPKIVSTPESDRIYRTAIASESSNKSITYNPDSIGGAADLAIADISKQHSAKIETGIDIQTRSMNSGTSTYNATEVPLRARFPIGYEAYGTLQVDQVNVDAGSLSSNFNNAALFGTIQAHQTQYVPGGLLTPSASGTSVGLGYEQGSVKVDIGKIGIGFPISNVVGGISQYGMVGRLSYSLNLSRRPYNQSLLSYAGARDPISGALWGGVTNTGVSLYMSTTLSTTVLGDFKVFALPSYGLLSGTNVMNNNKLSLLTGINQDIYATDNTVLNLGVSASYTSFSKNQEYFTFGHGGYFSPQSWLSFVLPIELKGRDGLLSYQIKANVSYAMTQADAVPFYPTDPALQALAASAPLPIGYTQPIYLANTGNVFGYGFLAAAEYRLTPNFALGGRFSLDRTPYFAPNSGLLYLRYMFNPETGPVSLTPNPVVPYSKY